MSGKMIVLIPLMLFMCCAGLFGQTYARKIEDFGNPTALASTSDGGNLLVSSASDWTLVRKVDANGKKEWQKQLKIRAELNAAVQLSNGTYILAGGEFFVENQFFLSTRGILVHLKSNGSVNWNKGVAVTTDDEIFGKYSVGGFESVVAFGDGFVAAGKPSYSGQHINVASFGPDGNIRWAKLFSIHSYGYSSVRIMKTPDQSLIIACGVLESDTGKNAGWFVFKIDSQGNAIWTKLLRQSNQGFQSATLSSDGQHLLLIGFRPAAKTTAYAAALDINGNLEWKKRLQIGSQDTYGLSGAATIDGFAIAGYANARGFITRLDASGKIRSTVITDHSPDFILPSSDSGYTLFGNDATGTVIAKIDSSFNLPGCNLFQPVKAKVLKFGALKKSTPQLQSATWVPAVTKLDFRSKNVSNPDSQLCP